MWIIGTRTGGVVERIGDTRVESHFAHFNFLPFLPTGSYLVLGDGRVVPIPRHRTSLIAGYARGWGWAASLGTFFLASRLADPAQTIACVAGFVVMGGWIASFRLGALSSDETKRRRVYEKVTGYLADPSLLTHANPSLAEHLELDLETRAEALAPDGYRGRAKDWRAACDGTTDPEFLALALTLARVGVGRGDTRDRALHDRIWSRLAPVLDRLPARIEPLTRIARQDEPVAPLPSVPRAEAAPVEAIASRAGNAIEAGWDVTIASPSAIDIRHCASCMRPTTTTLQSTVHGFFSRKSVEIPTCQSCRTHAHRSDRARARFQTIAVIVAFGWALLGLASSLSYGTAAAWVAVLSTLTVASIPFLRPPRKAEPPATVTRTAARLVRARGSSMTLHCLNEDWAKSVAERAGTTPKPRRRLFHGALDGMLLIPVAVQAAVFATHWLAHPDVRIDNGTGAPIRIWVDNVDEGTIEPSGSKAGNRLPTVSVGWGEHKFEWAPASAPDHRKKVTAKIEFNGTHLWDPGEKQCYWLQPTIYGKATADEAHSGPRPRTELYTFIHVHDWFVESPSQIQTKLDGEVRYSLQRDLNCPKVAACGSAAVDKYWDCLRATGEVGSCTELANELCDQ